MSVVPEYLRTTDQAAVHDYNEYQPQLGRRFRALKIWFVLRYFGLDGLRARIAEHLDQAARFASWVDAEPHAERLAPVPFATVCFRWHPRGVEDEAALDRLNERLMARLNATGEVFLSHTRLGGRFALRLALGNLRTELRHVERAWALVRELGPAWPTRRLGDAIAPRGSRRSPRCPRRQGRLARPRPTARPVRRAASRPRRARPIATAADPMRPRAPARHSAAARPSRRSRRCPAASPARRSPGRAASRPDQQTVIARPELPRRGAEAMPWF